jgi:hypothetical protein
MKLLKTINKVINEAENNLYEASLTTDSYKEIKSLEKRVDESLKLLKLYEDLF